MERRHSKKREAILECLRATKTHPTANWVYDHLRDRYPDLSLGTVYRNLRLFQEEGAVHSLGVIAGFERFDATTTPHNHFVCRVCGSVLDVTEEDFSVRLPNEMGCGAVESCSLVFHGVCRNCQN